MKVFSTAFQSSLDPTRMAMYSVVANDADDAKKIGWDRLIKEQGNLNWIPIMAVAVDIDSKEKAKIADITTKLVETKNWLLNLIVKNKDRKLFNSSKKYLTNPEVLFIKSKIHANKN